MIGVDTNVVVRLLVADDAEQAKASSALFARQQVHVGATVLLETEWVLRSGYGLAAADIHRMLLGVLGLPGVSTESAERVVGALDAYAKGLDFADALHLFLAPEIDGFYSFDAKFRRQAGRHVPQLHVAAP